MSWTYPCPSCLQKADEGKTHRIAARLWKRSLDLHVGGCHGFFGMAQYRPSCLFLIVANTWKCPCRGSGWIVGYSETGPRRRSGKLHPNWAATGSRSWGHPGNVRLFSAYAPCQPGPPPAPQNSSRSEN